MAVVKGFFMPNDQKLVPNQMHYGSEVLPGESTHVVLCDFTNSWGMQDILSKTPQFRFQAVGCY